MKLKKNILNFFLSNIIKKIIKICTDVFLIFISIHISSGLVTSKLVFSRSLLLTSILISLILVSTFILLKVYDDFYRYFNKKIIFKIFFSIIFSISLIFSINIFKFEKTIFPHLKLNQLILSGLLIFIFLLSLRLIVNYIFLNNKTKDQYLSKKNCFIYGAGQSGINFEKKINQETYFNNVFFIDDDPNKIGRKINNSKIHSFVEIKELIKNNHIDQCFIVIPSINSFKLEKIKNKLNAIKINFEIIKNSNDEINYGNIAIRKIENKISKINHQDENNIKIILQKKFLNKTILITGAGGSIGEELSFQICNYNIKKIILIDKDEYKLSKLSKKLLVSFKNIEKKYYLSNLFSKEKIVEIFKEHKPNFIFHAGAYKHVDLVENNPIESCYNNLISTFNMVDSTSVLNGSHFIFISTDKAVNPTNYMGKTKKFGEILVASAAEKTKNKFNSVRFGNVIGSSGSLIPIINKQIKNNEIITLTDSRATRYFMTIQDSVSLILKTTTLEESKYTYVLEMGKPIKISTIIDNLIEINGKEKKTSKNNKGIEIIKIGLRPGEKLHEELWYSKKIKKTNINNIYKEIIPGIINYKKNSEIIEKDINNFFKKNSVNALNIFFNKYL